MNNQNFKHRIKTYKKLLDDLDEIKLKQKEYLKSYKTTWENNKECFSQPRFKYKNRKPTNELGSGILSTCFVVTSLKKGKIEFDDDFTSKTFADCEEFILNQSWTYFPNLYDYTYDDTGKKFQRRNESENIIKEDIKEYVALKYVENDIYSTPIILSALHELDTPLDKNSKIKKGIESIVQKIYECNGAIQFNDDFPESGFLTYSAVKTLVDWWKKNKQELSEILIKIPYEKNEDAELQDSKTSEELQNSKTQDTNFQQISVNLIDIIKKSYDWLVSEIYKQLTYYKIQDYDKTDPIRCIFALATINLCLTELKGEKQFKFEFFDDNIRDETIDCIFKDQEKNGLWKKYLPIVALPNDGNIYPFALFSLDRLIDLAEPSKLLFSRYAKNIESAIKWIKNNQSIREIVNKDGVKHEFPIKGWRSNHATNPSGPPQAWTTSLVFDVVNCMKKKLSKDLTQEILNHYKGRHRQDRSKLVQGENYSVFKNAGIDISQNSDKITTYHDGNTEHNVTDTTVSKEIKDQIKTIQIEMDRRHFRHLNAFHNYFHIDKSNEINIDNWDELKNKTSFFNIMRKLFVQDILENIEPHKRRAIILYGPPGTGKTSITESIAFELGYSFVRIDTGMILREGVEKAGITIEEAFHHLSLLKNTVILFDEIDECIRKRTRDADFKNRVLTNIMLTKLNDLKKTKDIIYFLNTNNYDDVDDAIKRDGRFDFRIGIGHQLKLIQKEMEKVDKENKKVEIRNELLQTLQNDPSRKFAEFDLSQWKEFTKWFMENGTPTYDSSKTYFDTYMEFKRNQEKLQSDAKK